MENCTLWSRSPWQILLRLVGHISFSKCSGTVGLPIGLLIITFVYNYQSSSQFTQVTSKSNNEWYNNCGYSLSKSLQLWQIPDSIFSRLRCLYNADPSLPLCISDIHQKFNVGHWNCKYMCIRFSLHAHLMMVRTIASAYMAHCPHKP